MPGNLNDVIVSFRENEIAQAIEIFMQVKVGRKDRPYVRFLWKNNGRIETYQNTSHIIDATDSPSIASSALKRSDQDNAKLLPSVQNVI